MITKPIIGITASRGTGELTPHIHRLDERYETALQQHGAVTFLIGNPPPDHIPTIINQLDGLIITGGPDIDPKHYHQTNTHSINIDPTRDTRDLTLTQAAQQHQLPLLGICRGAQAINVALGGTLHQHCLNKHNPNHPEQPENDTHRHRIHITHGSRLHQIYQTTTRNVNSLHHQSIHHPAPGLTTTATTDTGEIEAVEPTNNWPMLAIQWHPERMPPEHETPLFRTFVTYTQNYATKHRKPHIRGHTYTP